MSDLISTDAGYNIKLVKDVCRDLCQDIPIIGDLLTCMAITDGGLQVSPPKELALKYNNLFEVEGIGTGKMINGKTVNRILIPILEYHRDQWTFTDRSFAVNKNIEDSLRQYRQLLDQPKYIRMISSKTFEEGTLMQIMCQYTNDIKYKLRLLNLRKQYL